MIGPSRILFAAVLAALALAGPAGADGSLTPKEVKLTQPAPWGDTAERGYAVLLPPNLKPEERVPAIVLLHDAGDDPLAAVYRHGWIATASQAHFALVAPAAGPQAQGRAEGGFFNAKVWNAGTPGAAAWADAAFLAAVAKDIVAKQPIDPARIYLVGFGEGGAMAQRVLIEAPGRFAAIASVGGPLYQVPDTVKTPRPLLLMQGLADPTNPAYGGAVYTPWAGPGMRSSLQDQATAWSAALGCGRSAIAPPPEGAPADGGTVTRWDWSGCVDPGALRVIWVSGLGRQWPGTGAGPLPARIAGPANDAIFAPWEIWRFFEDRSIQAKP